MQTFLLCLACTILALTALVTVFSIGIHYFGPPAFVALVFLAAVVGILGGRYGQKH